GGEEGEAAGSRGAAAGQSPPLTAVSSRDGADRTGGIWHAGKRGGATMSVFTAAELEYLRGQRLGRIATSGLDGQPHVVPVGFRYDPEHDTIDVGGHGFAGRKKDRDVLRNPRVAIVVDDLAFARPW